jgi:AAA domain-containing protein
MAFKIKAEGGERRMDREEVRRALSLLIEPGQTFELRGLPHARSWIGTGSELDAAVDAAWELADGMVYWTINPCRPDLDKAASNSDVTSRRWLPIDCDAIRPADVSATDAEKGQAIDLACAIADHLSAQGWPDAVWVDSGNGGHLLYRVDLPNDALARQLVKGVLVALAAKFDGDRARVDRSIHNAARILKLPGTCARKGPESPERPHRMARLVWAPAVLECVTVEQMKALADPPRAEANGHAANPWGIKATGRVLDGYVKSAVDRECSRVAMTPAGDRNNALNTASFNLGTLAGWPEMLTLPARADLLRAALQAGLSDLESRKTIESGWVAGAGKPRTRPVDPAANGKPTAKPFDPNKRLIIWAREIKPRKVDWLWPGRIPVGKATTFAGQTGMGKTFAACDIAARISRGAEIPFAGGECFRQGKVLIISAEDDADDTIVPRLIDLGADLSQIAFLSPAAEAEFSLAALELLNNSLNQMAGDVRMVAIDPPTSYLGRVDDHKNSELRGLLAPLRRWSVERMVALILITHINKGAANLDAMARVMGSAAWVQAVRAAHMFVADPDARGKSLFLPLKVNNAKKPSGIGYQIIEQPDGRVVIDWQGEVETTADEAMSQVKKKSRGVCAVEWLEDRFRERREWESNELKRLATEAGISKNALWSPEVNALPIQKRQRFNAVGDSTWFWISRDGWPPETEVGKDGKVGKC